LFHKAIEQSGPAVRMCDRDDAAALTERTLAALGVARADVHKMQSLEIGAIIQAATKAQIGNPLSGRRELAPTVDGRTLPAHPFDPAATEVSRNIPLVIGCTKDETTMFLAFDPLFGHMSAEQARQRFDSMAGPRAAQAFHLYSTRRPNDPPTYWVTSFQTDQAMWSGSVIEAERKSAQNAAPVFLYRVDFHTTLANGVLRATHGTEMPFVFRKLDAFGGMDGDGPTARVLMDQVSQAWINFVRLGNPSLKGLDWPRYDPVQRRTMIIDSHLRVESDPDRDIREFWSS
jgi:para-nitrobenzyl esterase